MKKTICFLSLLFALAVSVAGQKNSKDPNAVHRNVGHFRAIEVSGGIDLYLTQGSEEEVAVNASSDAHRDRIVTEVEDGILKIYYEKSNWGFSWGSRKLKAYVTVKTLQKLSASGGSDVLVGNTIRGTRLQVSLSGGSDFNGSLLVEELDFTASGGSDADISGRALKLKIDASGGSDVEGLELESDYCKVQSSGGSDVKITVHKEL